jgi:hypothetical protein
MFVSQPVISSQEGVLMFSDFAVTSPGIGESGPVSVSGTQTTDGIASLRVKAFGKEVVANPGQLKNLRGFSANGMQLTYEGGYKELGGRTVYLVLIKGFTSGTQSTQRVEVNERGDFKIVKGASK